MERALSEVIFGRRSVAEKRAKHRLPNAPDTEGGSSIYHGELCIVSVCGYALCGDGLVLYLLCCVLLGLASPAAALLIHIYGAPDGLNC